jgi:hypothetical protein
MILFQQVHDTIIATTLSHNLASQITLQQHEGGGGSSRRRVGRGLLTRHDPRDHDWNTNNSQAPESFEDSRGHDFLGH